MAMKRLGPSEEFNLEGQWWLPDDPDRKVGGLLSYTFDAGIRLRLFDALEVPEMPASGSWTVAPLSGSSCLHGQVFGGPPRVTLLGTESLSVTFPSSPNMYQSQEYLVRWCLFDRHTVVEPSVRAALVGLSGMDLWVGSEHPTVKVESDRGNPAWQVRLEWRQPDELDVELGPDSASVRWGSQARWSASEASIAPFPALRYEFGSPVSVEVLMSEVVTPLRDLTALLTDSVPHVRDLMVQDESVEGRADAFASVAYAAEAPASREAKWPLLRVSDDEVPEVVRRWFAMYRDRTLRPALDRFFSIGRGRGFLEHRVYDTLAVLEVLAPSDVPVSDSATRTALAGLKAAALELASAADLPGRWRSVVVSRLGSLDRPPMADRVQQLTVDVAESLGGVIGDPQAFARRVVDIRNPLAHGGGLSDGEVDDAFWVHQAGQLVITAWLLQQLGFDSSRIREAMERTSGYRWTLDNA